VVPTTDTDALPEHQPVSSRSRCHSASSRATLGAARQPRRFSKNPASQFGLPIYRPIVGQSPRLASHRDDLLDRRRGLHARPPLELRRAPLPQLREPRRLHLRQSIGGLEERTEQEIRLDPLHARDRHQATQVRQDVDALPLLSRVKTLVSAPLIAVPPAGSCVASDPRQAHVSRRLRMSTRASLRRRLDARRPRRNGGCLSSATGSFP